MNHVVSPALVAAQEAEARVLECVRRRENFLLEAGAGAGKTYSLVEVLRHLINEQGVKLRRNNQCIACITYTNAATEVIASRIDRNPVVFVDTIHAFCWSLIKRFQPVLRREVAELPEWQERLQEIGRVGNRQIHYDLGYRRTTDEILSLHHDDVLILMVKMLPLPKFQNLLVSRFPIVLIDEYQDTNMVVMTAMKRHLAGRHEGPLIGLFGDHWQRIYDDTCGRISHEAIRDIGKGANFRSATSIVAVLNAMRPELEQATKDETFVGSAAAYHTNAWQGNRRPAGGGGHWTGDLPADVAHQYLNALMTRLKADGWDFDRTKILMLTHNVLAMEQGYSTLKGVFSFSDSYIKKHDDYIAFFLDRLEPACDFYLSKQYGKMFERLGEVAPRIKTHSEKLAWAAVMNRLTELRNRETIGSVIDFMRESPLLVLPESIQRREAAVREVTPDNGAEVSDDVRRVQRLRAVPYREVMALTKFVNGHTPFATKHSVKGDEFESVLVVVGRGWNRYDFNKYLEWAAAPNNVSAEDWDAYERNRNLFYVSCSRPTTRLAILFTQRLSANALNTLTRWFGANSVISFSP